MFLSPTRLFIDIPHWYIPACIPTPYPLDLSENLLTLKVIQTLFGCFRSKSRDLSPLLIIRKNAGDGLDKTSATINEANAESASGSKTCVAQRVRFRVSAKKPKVKYEVNLN